MTRWMLIDLESVSFIIVFLAVLLLSVGFVMRFIDSLRGKK